LQKCLKESLPLQRLSAPKSRPAGLTDGPFIVSAFRRVRPTPAGCVFCAIGAGASWLRLPVPDLRDLADRYATDPDYRLSLIKTKAWKSDRQAAENVRSNPTLILPAQDFEEP
jgi:hypothetical protein